MNTRNIVLRVLTSVVALSCLILIWTILPNIGMISLVSLITLALVLEYYKLLLTKKSLIIFLSSLTFLSYAFFLKFDELIIIFLLFFTVSFWALHKQNKSTILQGMGLGIVSIFYIAWPSSLFLKLFLSQVENSFYIAIKPPTIFETSHQFLIFCLLVVFSGDIFSWLGGSILKGKKWRVFISPGKTWSGFFCGLILSGLVALISFYILQAKETNGLKTPLFLFLMGFLSFLVAQTGDLFISVLKRNAQVKDSGSLLPGHGGILDLLDGFLLAFPFLYFICSLF